ncbi:MAG: ParB/RepB/Spo0J family partition protein [Solobacterium sp.]|jgi:ParB-like protein|uniref:ParB/RepB/Spo0J family partition protein n=1 Tax=uncultured Solobacterium sp. TaxID=747375 RepID=UPI001CB346D4|nr:ParB/RepB/Spo0J family partition protein [uncultured Solobacterium sp.]MBF1114591.1 ParB/RepB/Spo0J family partition protein [Solobacterium sp.]MBF1122537.1 ParB/RepB/Spo0J family partition protein [Solobacterium sp.]
MAEKKQKGLGRGLDSIFGSNVEQFLDDIQSSAKEVPGRREVEIAIEEIRPNPYQPRKEFDQTALNELADSIRTHGIFTPLLVRKSVSGYDLITGERRLRAAKIAGLKVVPAISVDFTEEQMMEIAILENVQREDLNAIEEATAYDSLVKKLGYTQEKLAERVGKSREYCANIMRLLKLPSEIQKLVVDKRLAMGHVRPLLGLKDEMEMLDAAEKIMKEKMSVREVEAYIRDINAEEVKPNKTKPEKKRDPIIHDLEHQISVKLGTKVSIQNKKLTIRYTDTEDLNRILEILNCLDEG